MDNSLEIRGNLLIRNTLLNLGGQAAPLFVGAATIPLIVRSLGTERFGLLSLAWTMLGYVSFFDLGVGQAMTKFVAEYLGRGEIKRLSQLVWFTVGFQMLIGIFGSIIIAMFTPTLVYKMLRISPKLVNEAAGTFFILAILVPIVLVSTGLRGILEAGQRFDLVNAVKTPLNILIFLIPASAAPFRVGLPEIVLLLTVANLAAALAYLVLCLRTFQGLRNSFFLDVTVLRPLFTFGGWVTISRIIWQALVYIDRFFVASLISVSAAAYYTVPFDIVTRLWIIPLSVSSTLFPAFSTLGTKGHKRDVWRIYARAIKYLILSVGPICLSMLLFSREILGLWLGPGFAENSTAVWQILTIGVFVNSLAWIPGSLLKGLGRPDVEAKICLLEMPLYIPLLWLLVRKLGITGAALAWLMLVGFETLLLFVASWRLFPSSISRFSHNGVLRAIALLLILTGSTVMLATLIDTILLRIAAMVLLFVLFSVAAWNYTLDTTERIVPTSLISCLKMTFGGIKGNE